MQHPCQFVGYISTFLTQFLFYNIIIKKTTTTTTWGSFSYLLAKNLSPWMELRTLQSLIQFCCKKIWKTLFLFDRIQMLLNRTWIIIAWKGSIVNDSISCFAQLRRRIIWTNTKEKIYFLALLLIAFGWADVTQIITVIMQIAMFGCKN